MQNVFRIVEKIADTTASVLIQGESGTGKELIARAIHFNSRRAGKAFSRRQLRRVCRKTCSNPSFSDIRKALLRARPPTKKDFSARLTAELCFLDEIGEMPPRLQVKLLRALQEHEVTPVGSASAVKFDARIIAATNKNLEKEVSENRFREDLFYRLNVIEISLPPLRERREDIPLLVKHFVAQTAKNKTRSKNDFARSDVGARQLQMAGQRPRTAKRDGTLFFIERRRNRRGKSAAENKNKLIKRF